VITVSASGGSGTGAVTYSTLSSVCSVDSSTGSVTVIAAGSCVVTAEKAADANYEASSANTTITISKASQGNVLAVRSAQVTTYSESLTLQVTLQGGLGTGAVSYSSSTTGVCTVNATTGEVSVLTAGVCSITATKAGDSTYLPASDIGSIVLNRATQATFTAAKSADTTYGSQTVVTISASGGSGTGAVTFQSLTPAVCSVNASTGVLTVVTAGSCSIRATKAQDTSYDAATSTVAVTIDKAAQVNISVSATYSNTTFGESVVNTVSLTGGSGSGSISFSSTTPSVCTVNSSNGVIAVVTAGTCTVTATKAADTNYLVKSDSISININKANQLALTVSSSIASVTFGSATVATISTTGGSGNGSVSFSTNTPAVCSVNSTTGVVTVITAGTCTIAGSKASDSSYNSASNTVNLTINKANQAAISPVASPSSAVYGDGSAIVVSITGGSGTGAVTYSSTSTGICSVNASTGEVTVITAGSCAIRATKATDTNYNSTFANVSIAISKATQTSLVASGNQNLVHSPSVATSQITLTGGSGVGTVSYSVNGTSTNLCTVSATGLVSQLHAGSCLINITKASDTNYNAATTSFTIEVAKATQSPLTVTGNQSMTYVVSPTATTQVTASGGSSSTAITYQSTTPSVCSASNTGLVSAVGAGRCSVTISRYGDPDYESVSTFYVITVAKGSQAALTVRTEATLNFNASTPATTTITVTGGSTTGAVTLSTTSSTCSINGTTLTALSAGACVISAQRAGDTNFNLVTASYTVIIEKSLQAALNVTASRTTLKFEDPATGTATITVSGGSGTGSVSLSIDATTASVCSINTAVTPAVVTPITGGTCIVNAAKASDNDYVATTAKVTLTITKNQQAALSLTSSALTAVRGETINLNATGGTLTTAITYSVVSGATFCSINNNTVSLLAAGTCTVKATRAGNANYDLVDSNVLTLTVTKAEQEQLVVAQSAGMLQHVAIGGRSTTTYDVAGGNGNGALSVANFAGCNASMAAPKLNIAAGTTSGDCVIDVNKSGNTDFNATTYRVSLKVFVLPTVQAIATPYLNMTSTSDGVGVDVPFTPAATGQYIAPVSGYQLQTKTGSNWIDADGGYAANPLATKVSIAVTPWTSMFMRVAAVSPYESSNGSSRTWVTLGGQTAQAYYVTGLISSLSSNEVVAKNPETITVTGMGFSKTSTPTVTITADRAVFEVKGKATDTLVVPASVSSVSKLTFKFPGILLPNGVRAVNTKVRVNTTDQLSTNSTDMLLTSDSDSVSLFLDVTKGYWGARISTVWAGSIEWTFKESKGVKIFTMPTCVQYKTVKGVKTCVKTELRDTATCSLIQPIPINKMEVRRIILFKSVCQLNEAGKLALASAEPITIARTSSFKRAYPKTNLPHVLVKGKKTKILKAVNGFCNYGLGSNQLVRMVSTCKWK
jgi:hypothetical protein